MMTPEQAELLLLMMLPHLLRALGLLHGAALRVRILCS